MSPSEHAGLLRTIGIIWFVGWILVIITLGSQQSATVGILVYFFSLPVVWQLLLWFVPIVCDQPGCRGRVWHEWVNQESSDYGIRYVCDDCGHEWFGHVSVGFDSDA